METAPGRRSALLLAAVVGLQLLLLAFQVRREGGPRLLSLWVAETYAPAARWATATVGWCRQLWRNYIALHGAREENQRLHEQIAALQLQLNLLAARAAEADRLSRPLAFRRSHVDLPVLAARVSVPARRLPPGSSILIAERSTVCGATWVWSRPTAWWARFSKSIRPPRRSCSSPTA